MNRRIVAALVMALLAISCSPDQSAENEMGKDGKGPIESELRAQRPADKISTIPDYDCPSFIDGCSVYTGSRSDRRKSEALVRHLRHDKPSWLRYVKAVAINSMLETSPQLDAEHSHDVLVQTGIFVNEAGKDMGAVICRAMLEEKVDSAAIYGVGGSYSGGVATPVGAMSMKPSERSRH